MPYSSGQKPDVPVLRRAAQYVRMSTDHQHYSIQGQKDAIAEYAVHHDIQIVRTYPDESKSGLTIKHRHALKRLISDVQEGRADFEIVIVFDISRWGRFQDTDESAYYEFICKAAGISVVSGIFVDRLKTTGARSQL
jgi:DNA invertase Pin-like site-specific DNA recombinase